MGCRNVWNWPGPWQCSQKFCSWTNPLAGMNLEETEDMARFILDINEERRVAIVLIEHDMGVVMDISDRVFVLELWHQDCRGSAGRDPA